MSREHDKPHAGDMPVAEDEAAGREFFERWSRRKAAAARGTPEADEPEIAIADGGAAEAAPAETDDQPAAESAERIDERTGKRFDELTDEDMPDPETLDENSDIRMFMARNVSPSLRMKALARRFRHPKYNKVCICAEYAEDYTKFEPLGNVVPHDLKTAIAREAEKLRDRLLGDGDKISPEEAEARVLRARDERQQRYRTAVSETSERKRVAAAEAESASDPEAPAETGPQSPPAERNSADAGAVADRTGAGGAS